jgi:hypothetical protein
MSMNLKTGYGKKIELQKKITMTETLAKCN